MKGSLVSLPLTGHAPDNKAIAAHFRMLAEELEADDAAGVDNTVVIFEYADEDITVPSCGKPIGLAHLIGLMYMAIQRRLL